MTISESYPHFFNAADLGHSLKEVSTEVLQTELTEVTSRWFHSAKDVDLFIWIDSTRNVLKQQLSFYGQVVEWNVVEGVRTGHVLIDDAHERTRGSEIVRYDHAPVYAAIEQAIALLRHVNVLGDLDRQTLVRNFSEKTASQAMDPEEFARRFGKTMQRTPRSVAPLTMWQRFCQWWTGG